MVKDNKGSKKKDEPKAEEKVANERK